MAEELKKKWGNRCNGRRYLTILLNTLHESKISTESKLQQAQQKMQLKSKEVTPPRNASSGLENKGSNSRIHY